MAADDNLKASPAFEKYLMTLTPELVHGLKTSDLLARFTTLVMRAGIGDGPTNPLIQEKRRLLSDEIDRRIPST